MKSILRVASLVAVSFAAASAFSTDAPRSATQLIENGSMRVQTMPHSGSAPRADLVKCTNPRECSVG